VTRRNVEAVSSMTKPLIPFRDGFRAQMTFSWAPVKSAFDILECRLSVDVARPLGCMVDRFSNPG
jgi:hypothetical protein